MTAGHPRISLCEAGLPRDRRLADHLATCAGVGAPSLGLTKWSLAAEGDSAAATIAHSRISPSYILAAWYFTSLADRSTWDLERATAIDCVDAAADLGAARVYGVTGGGYPLEWDVACTAFVEAIAPVVEHARPRGVTLMIEATNPVFADISAANSHAESVAMARAAGIGLCLDLHHVWTERDLARGIAEAGDLIGLVQVADYIPGERSPRRAPPGDGVIPLERLLGAVLETGYEGPFDLEVADTDEAGLARGVEHLSGLLDRLGV